ncbi:hypothetical protein SAMN05428976_10264 [Clostridium sp. USBA 49]|uniref:Clr5 domain-containing protein n=1 Tax=Clostridium sp. USBA 49 TaxID=1881060 RepID=UPI000998F021|nr:Clr5 domain-containing protein [Clostridium sp. USBA 49]SKA75137.1 hypothetical protein SAMN05428976_10264 [Clostridium sp. USBA 49]
MDKTADKKAEKKRERCKTCSCEYRAEIEEMYLKQGKSAPFIAKYLKEQYGYVITAQSLLRHFRICLRKAEKKEQKDKQSEKLRQEVLQKKIQIADMVYEIISYLYVININFHKKVMEKMKVSGRTESDIIRNYTGELREYLKLYKDLIADNGKSTKVNETQIIAAYEEYRKKNAEIINKIETYEVTEEEQNDVEVKEGGDNYEK